MRAQSAAFTNKSMSTVADCWKLLSSGVEESMAPCDGPDCERWLELMMGTEEDARGVAER